MGESASLKGGLRVTLGSALATALSAMPPFLMGSLLPIMGDDLGMNTGRLGVVIAVYFFAGAVAAVPGGRLADRIGGQSGLMVTASLTSASLILTALVASSWVHVAFFMVVAGGANGMAHPSGNLAIVRGVRSGRQGSAFGIKQAAAPLATMFAGLALPLLGLTLGWQAALLASTIMLPIVAFVLPRTRRGTATAKRSRKSKAGPSLLVVATASALAFGAATTVGAFLVDSVVSSGGSPVLAGTVLTAASVVTVGVRLLIGWQTDRMTSPSMKLVVGLMSIGALGFFGLATLSSDIGSYAALIAMGAGWGWPGLLYHAVAVAHPDAPAYATAVATTGNALGAALGPLSFGLIAEQLNFETAWATSATMMSLAAILMLLSTRMGLGGSRPKQPR